MRLRKIMYIFVLAVFVLTACGKETEEQVKSKQEETEQADNKEDSRESSEEKDSDSQSAETAPNDDEVQESSNQAESNTNQSNKNESTGSTNNNSNTTTKPSNGSNNTTTKPSNGSTNSNNTGSSNTGNSNNSGSSNNSSSNNTGSNSGSVTTQPSEPVHEHSWTEITEDEIHYYAWRTICNVCNTDMTDMTADEMTYHVAKYDMTTNYYTLFSDNSKELLYSDSYTVYDSSNYSASDSQLKSEADSNASKYMSYYQEVLRLVNEIRAEAGVGPLTLDTTLCQAASMRALEMDYKNEVSHTRPNGSTCWSVLDFYGVSTGTCGENIAAGQSSAASVVKGWKNSPSHYQNMINASFTKLGVGYSAMGVGDYGHYWCQLFTN